MNSRKNEHIEARIQAYLTEHPNAKIEHLTLNSKKNEQVNTEHPTLIVYSEYAPFTTEHFEQAVKVLNSKKVHVRGEYLRQRRLFIKISRTIVAEHMGLTVRQVRRIEEGRRKCSVEEVNTLARFYNLAPDSIIVEGYDHD